MVPLVIVFFLVGVVLIALTRQKFKALRKPTRKIAVLGRLSRGKLLGDLAARARSDYPGQSEEWY